MLGSGCPSKVYVPTIAPCQLRPFPELKLSEDPAWTDEDFKALDVWIGKVMRWRQDVNACPGVQELDGHPGEVARSLDAYVYYRWQEVLARSK